MRAGIGIGSNLGDRLQNLTSAIQEVRMLSSDSTHDRVSSVYETNPINCAPDAPSFLNAVVEIEVGEPPLRLLEKLQVIEVRFGRPKIREKNAPRLLDLDLLYVDNLTHEDEALILPHPFIYQRLFVLVPLAEISPDRILPNQSLSVQGALSALKINNSDKITKYN